LWPREEFTLPGAAEVSGSSALDISRDQYYQALCAMTDELAGPEKPVAIDIDRLQFGSEATAALC
jgi:hypothetical protein